ncbi:aminotransferase class IV family protein [Pseudophaeobacter profundi]|uniref:aminotransferase class IV family protein n=1 Tax=Pseudophaeobacter profundi TaxID=3034152 RepID=UPI00243005CB|nr:aminotransferase class IV family protein [Pseudophaeobacter profundi]
MESPFCPADAIAQDADFRLIETFGYRAGCGIRGLQHHLHRLQRSARVFGIPFDPRAQMAPLQALQAEEDLRCRLSLAATGAVELSTVPLPPTPQSWVVALAKQRVRSDDAWLLHKTTHRRLYDAVRNTLPAGVDEMLFLNERDELCEGTITNVFVTLRSGRRVTPPLSSGLLPGVLRQQLLEAEQVSEQVVTLQDLRDAQAVTLGNSLRGEIRAIFSGVVAPSR